MSRILVTGGAGFIGSHLVERLMDLGERVIVIDDLSNGSIDNLRQTLESASDPHNLTVDHSDVSLNLQKYQDVTTIYHLACYPRSRCLENPQRDLEVNVRSTINLLQTYPTAKFIFASNSGIYSTEHIPITERSPDSPKLPYDLDKKTSEEYIKMWNVLYGTPYTLFRFPTVYGPRQRTGEDWKPVISEFCNAMIEKRRVIIFGDGKSTRDFCYVSDLVEALIRARGDSANGETILLGTNTETSIRELFDLIAKKTGNSVPPASAPERPGEIRRMRYDYSKAHQLLGWAPRVGLSEGIDNVLRWMKHE